MSPEPVWRRYLRLRGADPEADLADELAHHLERRVEEFMASGLTREEAEVAARERLGDLAAVKRECGKIARRQRSRQHRIERLHRVTTEARQAGRKLRRRPGFTAAATVTLGLGIGATTAIFAVVNSVLLQPLPFPDPDRLVDVYHTTPGFGFDKIWQADGTYFTYRERNRVFEDLGLWSSGRSSVTGLAEPEEVETLQVTDGLLPILGVRASIGRRFLPADDLPSASPTVMLSEPYWRSRFGSADDVVGRTLVVGGVPREIIGVLPAGFELLDHEPQILVPFRFDPARARITNFSYRAVGRLLPGATLESAERDLNRLIPVAVETIGRGLTQELVDEAEMAAVVRPLRETAVGDVRRVLWTLLGTVGIVLLVATANVAGLFLVHSEAQQREVAVRAALGAGRRRAARGFLYESWLIGLTGGAFGVGVAALGLRALSKVATDVPRISEVSIGLHVLAFALGLALACALSLGYLAAGRLGRAGSIAGLREEGRGVGGSRVGQRTRSYLVVMQIALALVVLVGSGLMVRTLGALRGVNPGFQRADEVLTFRITVPAAEEPDRARVAVLHERILMEVRSVAGVGSAALTSRIPMEETLSPEDMVLLEDFPTPEGEPPLIHRSQWVSGDYFETMGSNVAAGRAITWTDVRDRSDVVVITEDLARRYWGTAEAAIGRRMRNEPETQWRRVVGVVGSIHDDGPGKEAVGIVFWPQVQRNFWGNDVFTQRSMAYVVRASGVAPAGLVDAVRHAVWDVNPNLPLANIATLKDIVRSTTARTEFTVVMLAIAAAVAVLLGAVGLYGVVSYAVARRTREIGLRIALGAGRGRVIGMVLGQGGKLVAIGLGLGALAALLTTRLLSALLFGVGRLDPLTYAVTATVLGLVAFVATYVPARRAAGVEPTEALRHE